MVTYFFSDNNIIFNVLISAIVYFVCSDSFESDEYKGEWDLVCIAFNLKRLQSRNLDIDDGF